MNPVLNGLHGQLTARLLIPISRKTISCIVFVSVHFCRELTRIEETKRSRFESELFRDVSLRLVSTVKEITLRSEVPRRCFPSCSNSFEKNLLPSERPNTRVPSKNETLGARSVTEHRAKFPRHSLSFGAKLIRKFWFGRVKLWKRCEQNFVTISNSSNKVDSRDFRISRYASISWLRRETRIAKPSRSTRSFLRAGFNDSFV